MKSILQITFFFLATFSINAQSSIDLKINHLLDGAQFQNEMTAVNDMNNEFMLDRIEYYLSGFSFTHDGGQVTEVQDLYVLVSLLSDTEPTTIELGQFEFDNLESVSFHFGVDDAANHSDPASYPSTHPLAPKFPSMHWGWTAGYRFIALEGKSGPNVNQELQYHCIGDQFYKSIEFDVNQSGADAYTVELDAEYKNLLSGINVSGGVIIHGDDGSMPDLVNNMVGKVFSLSPVTSVSESDLVNKFEVYPNPVSDGNLYLNIDLDISNYNVIVSDALGRKKTTHTLTNRSSLEFQNSGIYYVSISDSMGNILATRKVVVQ